MDFLLKLSCNSVAICRREYSARSRIRLIGVLHLSDAGVVQASWKTGDRKSCEIQTGSPTASLAYHLQSHFGLLFRLVGIVINLSAHDLLTKLSSGSHDYEILAWIIVDNLS